MSSIQRRYSLRIFGSLSCFDCVVIADTLVDIGHARAMAATLASRGFRLFDYTQFAEPSRDEVRAAAERLAAESGLEIEYIQRKNFRKEDHVRAVLQPRPAGPTGRKDPSPRLIHVFSATEPCPSFRPWHDTSTHQTFLKSREDKCLDYNFYFLDDELGLCYLHVPTWSPFRLQFHFIGHNWPARQRGNPAAVPSHCKVLQLTLHFLARAAGRRARGGVLSCKFHPVIRSAGRLLG